MSTKRSNNPYDLCQFTYADGRMCGLPTIPSGDGLCRSHASLKRFRPAPEEEAAAPSLTDFASDPPSQEDVQRAIGRIMQALAANRISTRRAATFGYLAQLLLQVHTGLQADQRWQSLQGARDLHTLLKMKYGPALRKDAEKRASAAAPAPPSESD
jgi:hypothetical protein